MLDKIVVLLVIGFGLIVLDLVHDKIKKDREHRMELRLQARHEEVMARLEVKRRQFEQYKARIEAMPDERNLDKNINECRKLDDEMNKLSYGERLDRYQCFSDHKLIRSNNIVDILSGFTVEEVLRTFY